VGKLRVRRPWHRWEDNIKMDLQEMGQGSMDCTDLMPDIDRWVVLVNIVIKLHIP
jgi:hypothetical protein